MKGKQVLVEGRLNINYDPANKKSWVAVITDRVELLGGGTKKAASVEAQPEAVPAPVTAAPVSKPAAKTSGPEGYVSF